MNVPRAAEVRWWTRGVVVLVTAALGLGVYGQGFDLLSDGMWLLGARTWLRAGSLYPHLAVETAPGSFAFVLPFYALLGQSGIALAVAKAISTGLGAAAGFVLARRAHAGALAWLVPLGTFAMGPTDPAVTVFALTVCAVGSDAPRRRWWVGITVAALATFGLAAMLAGAGLALATPGRPRRERLAWGAVAAGALLASYALAAGGDLARVGDLLAREVNHLVASVTTGVLGQPFLWATRGDWTVPFARVATGESLPAVFAGQAMARQIAAWCWAVLPAAVLFWAWRERRGVKVSAATTVALALSLGALLFSTAAREATWLATLWVWPGLIRSLPSPRTAAAAAAAVSALSFGPDLLEAGWLSLHARRPGLEVWDRPSARVQMASAQIDHWETIFAGLDASDRKAPVLVWPNRPGVYVMFDLALPTRQAALRVGDAVDTAAVCAELERTQPSSVVLVLGDTRATWRLRHHWPAIWEYLREHHRVVGNLTADLDPVRVLERLSDPTALEKVSLPERLADVEIGVSNETGPALRPGLTVGQTIQVGPTDLRGFSVRWRTAGRRLEVPARVRIWQRRGSDYDALLEFLDVHLVIPTNGYRSFLRFDEPVPGTAGQDIAITLELREDTADEVRLLWHRHDATQDVDIYPDGTAVVNRRPVPADLYFFSY